MLGLLADLVDGGVPVLYVAGNHDWWGGSFLRDRIGVDFRRKPARVELAGRTVLVAHGDGLGDGDLGYRCMKRILRARVTRRLFRWLHPDLGARLARRLSGTNRPPPTSPPIRSETGGRSALLQRWAAEQLERDPGLDIVAAGHAHAPSLLEVRPGRYYVNSGDWVRRRSYVTLSASGPPTLHEWETSR